MCLLLGCVSESLQPHQLFVDKTEDPWMSFFWALTLKMSAKRINGTRNENNGFYLQPVSLALWISSSRRFYLTKCTLETQDRVLDVLKLLLGLVLTKYFVCFLRDAKHPCCQIQIQLLEHRVVKNISCLKGFDMRGTVLHICFIKAKLIQSRTGAHSCYTLREWDSSRAEKSTGSLIKCLIHPSK